MGLAGSNRRENRNGSAKPATGKVGGNGVKSSPSPNGRPLEFDIPSDFESGRTVQQAIMEEVGRQPFDTDAVFAIRIALEEALVNAIKHGNKLDPNKHVKVWAKVSPAQFEVEIEDEGPGFERCNVADPTADENLHKCSGRGILLIEAYMSKVEWSRGGRRLRMVKQVPARHTST